MKDGNPCDVVFKSFGDIKPGDEVVLTAHSPHDGYPHRLIVSKPYREKSFIVKQLTIGTIKQMVSPILADLFLYEMNPPFLRLDLVRENVPLELLVENLSSVPRQFEATLRIPYLRRG